MDLKVLADKLKEQGLDLAEDGAKLVVDSVFAWLSEEVIKSENKYDDLLLAILPVLKPLVDKAVDKIDGEVG